MEKIFVIGDNVFLLQRFIDNIGEAAKSFRYFIKRDITVIQQHLTTLLFLEDNQPVAYGHLEKEGDEVWLGICVLPNKYGKGYGKQMMEALIQKAIDLNLDKITLTVDKSNKVAISLYEKMGFSNIDETDSYYKYQLSL